MSIINLMYLCAFLSICGATEKPPIYLEDSSNLLRREFPEKGSIAEIPLYFKAIDINKNGLIELSELSKWIEKTYSAYDKEAVRSRLKACDYNMDRYLSFEEHLNCIYDLDEDELEYGSDEVHRVAKSDRVRFNGADVNRDKLLSFEELLRFLWPSHYKSMEDVEIQVTLVRFDDNNDGVISLEEFIPADSAKESENLLKQFNELDKNNDKKLTVEEFKPWIYPNLTRQANAEAEEIIRSVDTDGDGKLSSKELQSRAPAWIKSQMTQHPTSLLHES